MTRKLVLTIEWRKKICIKNAVIPQCGASNRHSTKPCLSNFQSILLHISLDTFVCTTFWPIIERKLNSISLTWFFISFSSLVYDFISENIETKKSIMTLWDDIFCPSVNSLANFLFIPNDKTMRFNISLHCLYVLKKKMRTRENFATQINHISLCFSRIASIARIM